MDTTNGQALLPSAMWAIYENFTHESDDRYITIHSLLRVSKQAVAQARSLVSSQTPESSGRHSLDPSVLNHAFMKGWMKIFLKHNGDNALFYLALDEAFAGLRQCDLSTMLEILAPLVDSAIKSPHPYADSLWGHFLACHARRCSSLFGARYPLPRRRSDVQRSFLELMGKHMREEVGPSYLRMRASDIKCLDGEYMYFSVGHG
ncbi:hypothetical protein SISSUDRAFT_1055348 [Sistotremastrum suecicum HHB10207 ss-3]|uniref:Uncharacterized protein n=1 Tax=Sistotremastrum suecicum HHB10207 ss-3 TaxID=1314776 RepID=A0A165XV21_9AGAM|nr:hypothetical protein SISSUDRAFT_1055348 [Sistotremastrum suecicum HHB10207 ss-3]